MLHALGHFFGVLGFAAEATDLGPARYAWLEELTRHVLTDEGAVLFGVLQHVGAGAYDAHVPF